VVVAGGVLATKGVVSNTRVVKERFKGRVKAAGAEWVHPFESDIKSLVIQGGNNAAYMRIAGAELDRVDGLEAEQCVFSRRTPGALQNILKIRTQGSRDIACHCQWKRGHNHNYV
jgi:hypothetical protein